MRFSIFCLCLLFSNLPPLATDAQPARVLIAVNQVGYFPSAPKHAVYARADRLPEAPAFTLHNAASGALLYSGQASAAQDDSASGDVVYRLDFSAFTTPGMYVLRVENVESVAFRIADDLYTTLKRDALRYFYLNRSGIALEAEYAGEAYARPAGHVSDADVTCFAGQADGRQFDGCAYRLDASGGWYDAGDFGKYVVNSGIATWTLLNWYERSPASFPDGALNIPESGSGTPDILDEARWQMQWMLAMQVPDGQPLAGMAHHKLHALQWEGLPMLPPTMVDNAHPQHGRLLMPPSTAATLNLAATGAQCARIWRDLDPAFAEHCLTAAEKAFSAAQANPALLYGNIPGNGGGNYDDGNVSDEFYWAAAELYATTGAKIYRDFLTASPHLRSYPGGIWWGGVGALGTITLATLPNDLPDEEVARLRDQLVRASDALLMIIEREGYAVPLRASEYVWGSSSSVLNHAMVLAWAHDFTGDSRYLAGVVRSMDYLLGHNANDFSFVSGYGTRTMQYPHHRVWANQPPRYPAPPPGAIAGGPNGSPADPRAINTISNLPPARRYIDHVDSYSTNEVAINWNAPLVWVAAYLDEMFSAGLSG